MLREVSASHIERLMACPGYSKFQLPRQPQSESAKEGVAAGNLLRLLHSKEQNIPTTDRNGIVYDDDMYYHAGQCLPYIAQDAAAEVKCNWQSKSGWTIKCRYDFSWVTPGTLHVLDYKWGWILVNPVKNYQLLCYAIGEILRRGQAFDKIVMYVLQPRPHHEDSMLRVWEISYAELLEYKNQIDNVLEQIDLGNAPLQTGTNCKYCPAAGEACIAMNRAFYNSIDYTFNDQFKQDQLSEVEISQQLDLIERVESLIKIKKDSIKELALNRIAAGKIIPGWTQEQSLGDRTWNPKMNPAVVEMLCGISIYEKKLVSPAQAEKMKVPKDFIANNVVRKFLGTKLVRGNAAEKANKVFNNNGGQ